MINIGRNFENYDRVRKAFKEFVHALVWETTTIEEGLSEDDVDATIDEYCAARDGFMIGDVQDNIISYIKSTTPRYHVCAWKKDHPHIIDIHTNNLGLCIKKVTEVYAKEKEVKAYIYDNVEDKFIVELG